MRKVFLLFLLIFSFSFGEDILSSLEKKFLTCESIKADFVQKTYVEGFDEPQIFEGKLFITKPNKIKIEYTEPIRQIIFVEGNKSIVYTPEENQAVESTFPEDFLIVKIFRDISQNKNISGIFSVESQEKTDDGYILKLKTEDKKIKEVAFYLDREKNINKIQIIDSENNKVIIKFKDFKCLKDRLDIKLNLPKDVEIFKY